MYPKVILSLLLVLFTALTYADTQTGDGGAALQNSVEQLRSSIGRWDVTSEFLNADGTAAKTVSGTYEFSGVIPGRGQGTVVRILPDNLLLGCVRPEWLRRKSEINPHPIQGKGSDPLF